MGFIDTGSIYAPVQKVDPGPDGKIWHSRRWSNR